MHVLDIYENDDLVDYVPFCSDACHREYCTTHNIPYEGWNGCHEGGDAPEFCSHCGVFAGGAPECEHQRDNVIVNRFHSDSGERCLCGNWIQLPVKAEGGV